MMQGGQFFMQGGEAEGRYPEVGIAHMLGMSPLGTGRQMRWCTGERDRETVLDLP